MSTMVRRHKQLNVASKARYIEEEFRLAGNFTDLNKSKRLLIEPRMLTDHFKNHFTPRNVDVQPEIENPDLFPRVIPPDNITTNEEIHNHKELKDILKKQKDNKCQGTDQIYCEHLKYASSNNLISAILLSMIWTMIVVPQTWLASVITCLHKKGIKSIAKNYRSIFIMKKHF